MSIKLLTFILLAGVLASAASAQSFPGSSDKTVSSAVPLKIGGDVLPPKVIRSVEPKYPRPLFRQAEASMVVVGLIVTQTGLPQGTHIEKSGGESFDTAALKAVSQYRFEPATLHGKPVPVEINIEVQFQLF